MKSVATPFAIAGALLTSALLVATNLFTTPHALWCIPPVILLTGWPAGVYLCRSKRYTAFSIAGSLLLIAFLAALNWIAPPHTLWFPYAAPLILLWPAGMLLKEKIFKLPFALTLGALIIAYCLALNLWLTPHTFWAIHPMFIALWWPLGLYFTGKRDYKKFSVAGAALTVVYLIGCNLLTSPYPWALYACFPVVWWPLAMYFGKRLGGFRFSVTGALCTLAWYGALNLWLTPGSPWILFIAFPVLWWPLSVFFFGRRSPHIYGAVMGALSIAFFAAVNLIYSPGVFWAFYPAFPLLWWPMTLLFARKRAWRAYSVAASLAVIVFLAGVNLITSRAFLWFVFPALAILWWPLAMAFKGQHKPFGFSLAGAALAIATLLIINLMTSRGFLWFVFPALAILWWPLAMAFKGKHKPFGFSLAGAALAIATLLIINLMTSRAFLWFVFPALAILWWPATVFFAKRKSPFGFSIAGSLLVTALVISVNLITSPGFLWFVFPVFGVLWWPLGVYFHSARLCKLSGSSA
jgi:hypothetical protein